MLDDLKYIHQRDGQDALGTVQKQWQQLEHKFEPIDIKGDFENVVFAGMGGSALAGLISASWPGYLVPFEVCRKYQIPDYVSERTLFIASSYSGNTEETLSALSQAQKREAAVVVITNGGQLAEIAKEKGYPLITIPKTSMPRFSVLYGLNALTNILDSTALSPEKNLAKQRGEAATYVRGAVEAWLPTVAKAKNPAKQLAMEIAGKSPVIYAGPLLAPIAYKWKISFNENAKSVAWWNEFPEFSHNEFMGWTSHPVEKPYAVIDLRSSFEHEQVKKRFELTERLLSGKRPAPHIVEAQGKTLLQQLVWTAAYGDFVSIYLALLNGVNPTPIELIEKFKTELG